MKRAGIFLFYDKKGIVDEYIIELLMDLRKYIQYMIFVVNGNITLDSKEKVKKCTDDILVRKNIGFDVWGYKEGIEYLGYKKLAEYDEMILLNYTFFGPIFPFSEMFNKMDNRSCDFWGLAAYDGIYGYENVGYFIQSMFMAFRKKLFTSKVFSDYWKNMPMIDSKDSLGNSSFLVFEARFASHFEKCGFKGDVYLDPFKYPTREAFYLNIDKVIEDRCPILKRRVFLNDPIHDDVWCVNNRKALDFIQKNSDYNFKLIWDNILRTTELRTVVTNAELSEIFSDKGTVITNYNSISSLAVFFHISYEATMDEIQEAIDYLNNIPVRADLFITVENENKEKNVKERLKSLLNIRTVTIHTVPHMQDGDIATFLIEWKSIIISDEYSLLLKVHVKHIKPGINYTRNDMFKDYLFENLLRSPAYISQILSCFDQEESLGIICPPTPHMGTEIFGHTWGKYHDESLQIAKQLEIDIPFDRYTPLATYGRMFWARPKCLKDLFNLEIKYNQFINKTQCNDKIFETISCSINNKINDIQNKFDEIEHLLSETGQQNERDTSVLYNEKREIMQICSDTKEKAFLSIQSLQANEQKKLLSQCKKELLGVDFDVNADIDLLAGAIERIITYAAQNQRYYTKIVSSSTQAVRSYIRLENKSELIFRKKEDFISETLNNPEYSLGIKRAFAQLIKAVKYKVKISINKQNH